MSVGLAVFVKTPGHSVVKSRLAADRGRAYADAWYRAAAAAVGAVVRDARARIGVTAYWAVAEPAARAAGVWRGLPTLAQGEGGLGERMGRVHAELVARHGAGILLGADVPQISGSLLGAAVAWLAEPAPRIAFGPARDGGFWLFGANVAPPLAAWIDVPYSVAETGRDFRAGFDGYGAWCDLPTLTDADRAADLPDVLAELEALVDARPEQRALAAWMRAEGTAPS